MSHGGGSGEGELAELQVVDTMNTTEPRQLVGDRMVQMAAKLLDCHACHRPLKLPIFKCDADHLVCSSCRGVHGQACGRSVAQSTLADDFAEAAFAPCGYGSDPGYVVYHEAADHRLACRRAPCGCPERCGFSGSPQKLLKHVSDHSRTVLVVHYSKPGALSLPLSQRWQILVGEDDNADRHRNMFLVSLSEHGEEVEVSLVCVHADGSSLPPQFSCKITVEHSDDGTRQTLELPVMRSSSLSNGTPAPGEVKCMKVKKEYLYADGVRLTIHIDKLARPPPFSPKPPFSPTRPFSPMSPPFSPARPFSPRPSPKRRVTRAMSPSVASPPPSAAEGKVYKRSKK